MDQLQTRLDALEQQMHTVNHRLHWWRGLACGAVVLAGLTWALPAVIAQEEASQGGQRGLAQRVAALEQLLKHFSREGKEIFITGANLHIVNGLGSTDCLDEQFQEIPSCPNSLGNLIVGYNESRRESITCEENPSDPFCPDIRTGSHNVVVGQQHNFSRFGGLVVGASNTISGDFAVVSSGENNTASGLFAAVSGGFSNTASGIYAAVSGGDINTASGDRSSVSGGSLNTASGTNSSVSGGNVNSADGSAAVVSGGFENTAPGLFAVVSGGRNVTQETEAGWSAGSEADEVVVGNFRSP
jgi:hypothetical protein